MKESFWAKVLFREFTGHYIAMNPDERAKDVEQSIIALTRLDASGDSFGAKMVGWANERMEGKAAIASAENGKKGGRPPATSPPKKSRPPKDMQEVYDFASDNGIYHDFARNWFARNYEERPGVDKYGELIKNWKGALINDWKANGEKHNEEPNPF